ncbi:MAG: SDR family oxidoreductase [Deltaproteobacteria bacterium]|nr:SDR family oxidoreductase [Deltaproteobacteria bacterium]
MPRLRDRVAVVTGAARGIGSGIARAMAGEGAVVVLWDILGLVEETAQSIRSSGQDALSDKVDVSDPLQVNNAIAGLNDSFGRVDILVNNAGIAYFAPFVETTDEKRDMVFRVNFNGVWNCTKAILPGMLARGYGRIINISSVTGPRVGDPGLSAYSATKGAVCGLARTLALEVAGSGVTVNTILPGYIETPLMQPMAEEMGTSVKEAAKRIGKGIPMKRLGTVEEVGDLAVFLASDESAYITGQEFVIDGGNILQEKAASCPD